MRGTDPMEIEAVFHTVKDAERVPAQNIHVVCFAYLTPQSFQLNCRFRLALCQQERSTLAARHDPSRCALRSFRRRNNKIIHNSQEFDPIRQAIDHESRERLANIDSDVSVLLHGGGYIHAMCLQSWKKPFPMGFSRNQYY